jgi:hypothetical protein
LRNLQELEAALNDLGYRCQRGPVQIEGFGGQRTTVDLAIQPEQGYALGFRRAGECYELVADWFGVRGVSREGFLAQTTQRYAYHTVLREATKQKFTVRSEETMPDGTIRLVVQRWRT